MHKKRSKIWPAICLFPILLLFIFGITHCRKESPSQPDTIVHPLDRPQLPSRGFFMGLLPIPADGQSFADAYQQASWYAEFAPVWGRPTPFYGLAAELAGDWGQLFVGQYIRGNGMFPLIHFSFIGAGMSLVAPPGLDSATLAMPEWRSAYKQSVLEVVRIARPLYLSIGNEVNRWYEAYGMEADNPNGFQHYISLYEEIYDAVKAVSPEARVFCTFAREIVSENREADLSVLSLFHPEKLDLLVFTSYPYAVQGINRPADLPNDYYARIYSGFLQKEFGFSELGWPSLEAFGGEQGQADFLREVSTRLTRDQGVALHLLGWAWLHDLGPDDALGLIRRDGTEKMAYQVWKSLSTSGE